MSVTLEKLLSNVGDLNYQRRIKAILGFLDIQAEDRVLDCGCGDGFYTWILTELYDCEVHALDFDYQLLEEATRRIKNKERLKLIEGDITKGLPFEENYFDKIIFTEVLEHLEDDIAPLRELKRVLRPGGKLAMTVPHKNYPFFWDPLNWIREHLGLGHFDPLKPLVGGVWAYDHKRLYDPGELRAKIKKSGLKVVDMLGLTHYTVPFTLSLLYIGKQVYTRLPLPRSIVSNLEKFESAGGKERKKSFIIEIPFKFAKMIDEKNNDINFIEKKSFITLFVGCTKKAK